MTLLSWKRLKGVIAEKEYLDEGYVNTEDLFGRIVDSAEFRNTTDGDVRD